MGRKTWESLPRALPERQNIVVTRQRDLAADGAEIAHSFAAALALVRLPMPGVLHRRRRAVSRGTALRDARSISPRSRATSTAMPGFPPIDRDDWRETSREEHPASTPDGFGYAYVTYERATASAAQC